MRRGIRRQVYRGIIFRGERASGGVWLKFERSDDLLIEEGFVWGVLRDFWRCWSASVRSARKHSNFHKISLSNKDRALKKSNLAIIASFAENV